jgi:circadian clock protein KaiC
MSADRIPSGVPGLDDILKGGFIKDCSYLFVGRAGTGKTLTSLQWLLGGRETGEKCLYIGLSEPVDSVIRNAASLGWDIDHIEFVDLYPSPEDDRASVEQYTVFPPSEVERVSVWESVFQHIREASRSGSWWTA